MALIDDLGADPIGLDTALFIYFVEEHLEFRAFVEPLFIGLDGGRWSAVTSGLTLLETLVVPYRAGDTALAERYEALLSRSRGLRLVELDLPPVPGLRVLQLRDYLAPRRRSRRR